MADRPLREITDEEVAAYWRDGAVCLPGLFGADWLARVGDAIEEDLARPTRFGETQSGAEDRGRFFTDYLMWLEKPSFRHYVLDSPAVEIAARLLGSETVRFFLDGIFVKEPGTEMPTPWHHDQSLYPIDGRQLVTLWMPVDPVARDCSLRFVRGSHDWGRWFVPYRFKDGTLMDFTDPGYEPTPDIEAELDRHDILGWDTAPGDCLAFHDRTLHAAHPNASSTTRRRVLSTRWLGDDVRYAPRQGTMFDYLRHLFEERGARLDDESVFPRLWPR